MRFSMKAACLLLRLDFGGSLWQRHDARAHDVILRHDVLGQHAHAEDLAQVVVERLKVAVPPDHSRLVALARAVRSAPRDEKGDKDDVIVTHI